MDEWDSVRLKIRELEQSFLKNSPEVRATVDTLSVADFWKRRYEEEKQIWERMVSAKEKEQEDIQEKFQNDEQGIRDLNFKIREPEHKLDAERVLWEERSKSRQFESELEKRRIEFEDKMVMLHQENEALKTKLEKGSASHQEEAKLRAQMEQDKKKMEQELQALEKRIQTLAHEEERKIDAIENQKRDLRRQLDSLEVVKRETLQRNDALENEVESLRDERNRELRTLEDRETEHFQTFEELTRGFVHRVRNHLGIMSGTLQLCTENLAMDAELKKQLQLVSEHSQEMLHSIEEFLDLIRIPEMHPETVAVNDLVSGALFALEETIQARNVKVDKKLAEGMPKIKADPRLATEAFKQLILNALEASAPGQVVTVASSSEAPHTQVKVRIADEGKGIPENQSKKIFRPYFSTRKGKKGLGLTLAKHAIDLHHGGLALASSEGKGTTVTIQLPAAENR